MAAGSRMKGQPRREWGKRLAELCRVRLAAQDFSALSLPHFPSSPQTGRWGAASSIASSSRPEPGGHFCGPHAPCSAPLVYTRRADPQIVLLLNSEGRHSHPMSLRLQSPLACHGVLAEVTEEWSISLQQAAVEEGKGPPLRGHQGGETRPSSSPLQGPLRAVLATLAEQCGQDGLGQLMDSGLANAALWVKPDSGLAAAQAVALYCLHHPGTSNPPLRASRALGTNRWGRPR